MFDKKDKVWCMIAKVNLMHGNKSNFDTWQQRVNVHDKKGKSDKWQQR